MTIFLIIFCVFCFVMALWKLSSDNKEKTNTSNPLHPPKTLSNKHVDISDLSIEESYKRLEEIKNSIAEIRKMREKAQRITVLPAHIYEAALSYIEMMKRNNDSMEKMQTPEIVENSKNVIENYLNWFIDIEMEYPYAPTMFKDGAEVIKAQLKNRYNELLYIMAKKSFNEYKIRAAELVSEEAKYEETEYLFGYIDGLRRLIDIQAGNYNHYFAALNEIHYKVEETFSDLQLFGG